MSDMDLKDKINYCTCNILYLDKSQKETIAKIVNVMKPSVMTWKSNGLILDIMLGDESASEIIEAIYQFIVSVRQKPS